MANQIQTDATTALALKVAAHNSLVHFLGAGGLFVHSDGPDTSKTNVAQYPSGGAPATLSASCTFLNSAKGWWNSHLSYFGTGFAHKAADAANTTAAADMSAGSAYEATMLAALIVLATEETTDYINHIANSGATPHTGADTVDILGAADVLVTLDDVAERLNNIKAQFNLHIVNVTGVHGASGAADAIVAANATASGSAAYDSCITLANAIRTAMIAHAARGAAIHPGGADAVNVVSGAAVSYPAGMFTLAIELKADMNAHIPSGTYHYLADATTIASADPTTVASLITIASEIYTDMLAHFNASPGAGVVQALRLVA